MESQDQNFSNFRMNMLIWFKFFLQAERNAHLTASAAMIPYDCAFDHLQCFRCGLVYLIDMHSLSSHARDVENAFFIDKQQCISRSNSISFFIPVSTDHALKQSQIKDSKSSGGIVGTSQDKDTREQWTLTIHMKSLITMRFKEMSGISISIQHNKKLFKKRKKRGENDVYKLIETVKELND